MGHLKVMFLTVAVGVLLGVVDPFIWIFSFLVNGKGVQLFAYQDEVPLSLRHALMLSQLLGVIILFPMLMFSLIWLLGQ